MKRRSFPILALAIASLFVWQSCNQVEETGTIRFGLDELMEEQQLKSVSPNLRPSEALVSIMNENGQLVYDKEPLPLYNFGEELVTKSLKLEVGRYKLVEFMLVDTMGVIIWATPKDGSPLADLVRNPLPIGFKVTANETTNLSVEVVRVGDHPPSDFGYVSFDIDFVNRFCMQVFFSSRCLTDWNDSILTANGSYAPVHESRFIVWTENRKALDEPLFMGLNNYTLPVSESYYHVAAVNCHADTFYHKRFKLEELMRHRCGPNYNPLVIYDGWDSIYITPEGLEKPTIMQGVFGKLTVAVNDSSANGNNNFKAVDRDVYFFPYIEVDSFLYGYGPIDCLYQGELPADPLFISRSNTSGYYQAPLQAGAYLYMVKQDNGFFIDLYISSHLPGKVEVFENKVTELNIFMIDCGLVY